MELEEEIYSTDFVKFRDKYTRQREELTKVQFEQWEKSLLGKKVR